MKFRKGDILEVVEELLPELPLGRIVEVREIRAGGNVQVGGLTADMSRELLGWFRPERFQLVQAAQAEFSTIAYTGDTGSIEQSYISAKDFIAARNVCTCDFKGPNAFMGCRCGAFQKEQV